MRRLSAELGCSKSSVSLHLKALGKVNRRCREVPHALTKEQENKRVEICRKLLQNLLDERYIKRIITCDEKWIFFNNPDKSNQWLNRGETAQCVPKRDRFEKKVMLCVFWNYERIIHFELIPDGRTITSELYCEQLERMYQALVMFYPALVNRKRALLQQDNARPHTSAITQEKIKFLDGIELLPHPAYSPDLAPSDYHLFRSMAHFLRGRRFVNINDVENGCHEFFDSKSPQWYRKGIEQLANRWIKTIEHEGIYFSDI